MQVIEIIADMLNHAPPRFVIVHGEIYDTMQRNPRCRCAKVHHTATVEAKGKRARRRAKGKARK